MFSNHFTQREKRIIKILTFINKYIRKSKIVFDFTHTEFMDSSGVGLLMGRYRAMGMRKESIQAVGVSRHIDRLLHLSGLHRYIEIQKAEEEEA